MKKLLCVILALVIFLSLISCEKKYNGGETAAIDPETNLEVKVEDKNEQKPGQTAEKEESTDQTPFLTVKGVDISKYKIVYFSSCEEKVKDEAERLAEYIKSVFAIEVDIVVDPEDEIERSIVLSDTLPEDGSSIKIDTFTAAIQDMHGSIWISATNEHTLKAAIDKIIADATPKAAGATVYLNYAGNNKALVEAEELGELLKVMTYNVKNGYVTSERQTNTVDDIISFMPDTIGVQEFNLRWYNIFENKGVFENYAFVGEQRYGDRDREANDNEYSAVLYRKDKFRLVDSGTYWLSETPNVPDTKLAESKYVRIMTYAVLERISDGVKFVHVNTHLNSTPSLNLRQMEILVSLVNEKIYAKHGELPTYFTGDFNAAPQSQSNDGYKYLISTGTEDSRFIAEITSNENTIKNGGMIDHCIVSKGDFIVTKFDVGDEKQSTETSNHFPVYVEMYIIPKK